MPLLSALQFANAGQTCIAPDYVLCNKSIHAELVSHLKAAIQQLYGADPASSGDLARLINTASFDRIHSYMSDGTIAVGGDSNRDELFISPTVMTDVSPDAAIMKDEIFGPLLPILRVDSVTDAIHFINLRPKPLAVYVYAGSSATRQRVFHNTLSGSYLCTLRTAMTRGAQAQRAATTQ